MPDEAATAVDFGGPERASAAWLILQRLDDLRRGLDDLRRRQDELRTELSKRVDRLEDPIEWVRNWSLGLLLLAILGLLTKPLIPEA